MEHHPTNTPSDRRSFAPGKRSWLMIIGCTLPFAAILLLPLWGVSWGTALLFLFVLACPLMHLLGMHGGHHGHHQPRTEEESTSLRKE